MTPPRSTVLASLVVGLVASCGGPRPPDPQPPQVDPPAPTSPAEDRFTGTITEINFGCAVDGSCDLTIDGTKHVHFGHDTRGGPPTEWGTAEDVWTLMQEDGDGVGRKVEVYAATTDHASYSIEGKTAYYIKLVRP